MFDKLNCCHMTDTLVHSDVRVVIGGIEISYAMPVMVGKMLEKWREQEDEGRMTKMNTSDQHDVRLYVHKQSQFTT